MGEDEWEWDDIPVAELTDERPRREPREPHRPRRPRRPGRRPSARRGPRSRRYAAAALAAATVLGAGFGAQRVAKHAAPRRTDLPRPGVAVSDRDTGARTFVFSALRATTAASNFRIRYGIGEHGVPASASTAGAVISGSGVVSVNPTAMVTTADVPGLGAVTTRSDGTDVWEDGGRNYGMAARPGAGTGAPLSQFTPLVLSTRAARRGAIAMDGLASPTGYLDLARESITAASSLGPSAVDGVATHDYEVSVDAVRDDRPGLTDEEAATSAAAHAVLRREGYVTTTVRLSVDGAGFVRRARSETVFADGGSVEADATFSDFGCSATILGLDGPTIVPDPSGCAVAPVPLGPGRVAGRSG